MNKKIVFLTNPIHPAIHAELETVAHVTVSPTTSDQDLIAGAESASVIVVRHPCRQRYLSVRLIWWACCAMGLAST